MPNFEMESILKSDIERLSKELFTMKGVNEELYPIVTMSAPTIWKSKPITDWPKNTKLFKSRINFLGYIPIDLHDFEFSDISKDGFKENSSSLMNKQWKHERSIVQSGDDVIVRDRVDYESKVGLVGLLLKPVYKSIFRHRHSKLKAKYGTIS